MPELQDSGRATVPVVFVVTWSREAAGEEEEMPEMLVSVKMITYNHAHFIAQAIEGVLRQKTDFPFELVIGEDCSTDGTREIVFEYQKKHPDIIRVITSDKNVGMKKNGLRVIKACRGKYVAFCEGDDHWHHPLKLQKQVDYLENHPRCGLVYSRYDVYHVTSKKRIDDIIRYRKEKTLESPRIIDIVEGRCAPLTCTVMLRRTLYEQVMEADPYLYQSDEFIMGDTQLWAEISTIADLHCIPESLATHNITSESATRSKDVTKVLRFGISGAKLMLYLCSKYNLPSHTRERYQEYLLNCSLRLAFHTKNKELADEIRRKKKTFTLQEWLRYSGAGNMAVHSGYRVLASLRNLFRREDTQWL
jgi:glycosyltransferase involved in cell wall biosynthesis